MAIIGTFKHWANHTNKFTKKDIQISYPNDLPKEHPDFEKKGKTETVEIQEPVLTTKTYKNTYCNLNQVTINKRHIFNAEEKRTTYYEMQFTIRVFKSKNSYDLLENPIYDYVVSNLEYKGDHNNIFADAYSRLKQRQGFEEMVDDI